MQNIISLVQSCDDRRSAVETNVKNDRRRPPQVAEAVHKKVINCGGFVAHTTQQHTYHSYNTLLCLIYVHVGEYVCMLLQYDSLFNLLWFIFCD